MLRVRYLLRCFRALLTDKNYVSRPADDISDSSLRLVILKPDAIGDYILFRNYLEAIRNSHKYKQAHITLIGNSVYSDLFYQFDNELVNDVFWINRSSFANDNEYRKETIRALTTKRYTTLLVPVQSRDFLISDSITRVLHAGSKIAPKGDDSNEYEVLKWISCRWYTKLADTVAKRSGTFEFKANKLFIEKILEEPVNVKLSLNGSGESNIEVYGRYAVLFPGAGEKLKQWNVAYFAEVANYLINNLGLTVLICGAANDSLIAQQILQHIDDVKDKVIDYTGKTTLTGLIDVIRKATILVSNDSSAVHIAACTNTQTICMHNGRHYGRFSPYPNDISTKIIHVYPSEIERLRKENIQFLIRKTNKIPLVDVNEIKPAAIIGLLDSLFKNESFINR